MNAPKYLQPTIKDIAARLDAFEGQRVVLEGWLYNKRSSGKIHFLQLRDGSATLQCVMGKNDVSPEIFERAAKLSQETSIIVTGTVRRDARSPLGFELGASDLTLVSPAESYPIAPKDHGVAYLMDHRHLWLRSSRQHKIVRIRHTLIKAIRDYFDSRGFVLVDAPIFTPNPCEGTTNLFGVEYFDRQAFLTQSGQLYMEAAAMAHGKVYCFGPTFRAEKSKTRRHLTEFWMVEPEVAYMDLDGDMDLAEDMLVELVGRVLAAHRQDLDALGRDVKVLENVQKPFPRIAHKDAVDRINAAIQSGNADTRSAGTESKQREGTEEEEAQAAKRAHLASHDDDFGGDDETILSRTYDRPVMVHRYPAQVKAFYMKRDPKDAERALCVDVLAPEGFGEIIGGGQREDDLEVLLGRIDAHQLPREAFGWYTDLRRYGSVPHAGFGIGVERTLAWLCGLHHVRETIPFPRMMERLSP
ncbi:MAG: asparagine--tRNA ligase [Deltaproteobacteria bacterium]|nr:asparagine--tRNA ligase [Deltaproteobacteria bacterium]